MSKVEYLKLFLHNPASTGKFVQKPAFSFIKADELKNLKYAGDELFLSTKKKFISLREVKKLFPQGRLEDNYIIHDIKDALSRLKTDKKVIDLNPKLTEKDYEVIQKIMNADNGRYIEKWKGYSDTDIVPNLQKLALFSRTMRFTKQTKAFLEFDMAQWECVYDGVVKKPRDMIMSILEYKVNSDPINIPLGNNTITAELKKIIDKITDFINMFSVKNEFVAFRGDTSFRILSGIKDKSGNYNIAEIMEDVSKMFKTKYKNGQYDTKEVEMFVKQYLIGQDINQKRFMSIGMTLAAVEKFAKKIKWKIRIPQGTKGASIESYNIERKGEAEFLGQRNGVLSITNAKYKPEEDLWYFDAALSQNPIDNIVVNC